MTTRHLHRFLPTLALLLAGAAAAPAQGPPCLPCAGLAVDDPAAVAAALAAPPELSGEARLYVRWEVELDGNADLSPAAALDAAGATPWISLVFRTPAPVLEHAAALDRELATAAEVARAAAPTRHFQIVWHPDGPAPDKLPVEDYTFLFKRASVAVAGAAEESRVLPQPLPADETVLRTFYDQEVAAYLDGIALAPPDSEEQLREIVQLAGTLDPGRPIIVDAEPLPEPSARGVAVAARQAADGVALTFFAAPSPIAPDLAPFEVLAVENQGDLSFDPYSVPRGAPAWAFVRGSDLGLRVIVDDPTPDRALDLQFSDAQLREPEEVALESGEPKALFGLDRSPEGLRLTLPAGDPVRLLRLERPSIEELQGVEEKVTVETTRALPVEEILRRLQAFEDAHARRLHHYQATNTMHLRFGGGGATTVEATFQGEFFFRQGHGFDWAWQEFFVNGVRWKGQEIPEIPLIQPEKAAALPLEIHFTRQYRYRLRGEDTVEGRRCWVVDFAPQGNGEEGQLWRGTVWVDQQLFARVRTRAVQVGLEGEVISNEETATFQPVNVDGQPAPWSEDSFYLPLRVVGQQLLNVVNAVVVVEKETVLTEVRINGDDFEAERQAVLASDSTMVRDTDAGLRYLVKDQETGERVVKEGFDTTKLFAVGGVFWDDSFDYPIPLAGINYLSLDFKGTGDQLNVFFAGALLTANFSDPELFGSGFDAGVDAFAIALSGTDTLFREDREAPEEDVKVRPARIGFDLGHTVGRFARVGLTYGLRHLHFGDAKDTADDFVLPEDHVEHSLSLQGRYSRSGYRVTAEASTHRRSRWERWGLPGSPEYEAFDPATEDFRKWRLQLAKTWYFPKFRKLGAEIEYLGGSDLDRFSKYQLGYFGDARVHGYRSNRVRGEELLLTHLDYGINVAEVIRVEGVADAGWVTDEASGLDRELVAGVGLVGTTKGPWQTLIQFDLGTPVAGPDEGFVAFLAFLKLFR